MKTRLSSTVYNVPLPLSILTKLSAYVCGVDSLRSLVTSTPTNSPEKCCKFLRNKWLFSDERLHSADEVTLIKYLYIYIYIYIYYSYTIQVYMCIGMYILGVYSCSTIVL